MRLYYHPESECYFTLSAEDWLDNPDSATLIDVTGEDDHELAAVLDGIDIGDLTGTPEEYVIVDSAGELHDVTVEEYHEAKTGGMAGAIAASMAKWARKPADLYPTPTDCTYSLLPHLEGLLPPNARVWEPACADGQMVRPLQEFGYNVMATDLRPEALGGQGGVDFLGPDTAYHTQQYDAIITNPPFKAAELFIRRSLEIAPVVAMLLKAQFWNTGNRKVLFRETKPYMEYNLTWRPAFLEEERGKSPLMDCIWVVWVRGHDDLPKVDILDRLLECPKPQSWYGGL